MLSKSIAFLFHFVSKIQQMVVWLQCKCMYVRLLFGTNKNEQDYFGTRDSQHQIRKVATKRWQLTISQSPLVSAIHANCLWTVNLLFVEVIHLGLQNQKGLVHGPSTNIWHPALLIAIDIHVQVLYVSIRYLVFILFCSVMSYMYNVLTWEILINFSLLLIVGRGVYIVDTCWSFVGPRYVTWDPNLL